MSKHLQDEIDKAAQEEGTTSEDTKEFQRNFYKKNKEGKIIVESDYDRQQEENLSGSSDKVEQTKKEESSETPDDRAEQDEAAQAAKAAQEEEAKRKNEKLYQEKYDEYMKGIDHLTEDVHKVLHPEHFDTAYENDHQHGNIIPNVKMFFPDKGTLIPRKKYQKMLLHFADGHLFFREGHIPKEHHDQARKEIKEEIHKFMKYKHGNQKKFDLHNFYQDFVEGEFYEFVDKLAHEHGHDQFTGIEDL